MGVLYRGRDPILDRDVAIKVMGDDLSDDEDARTRFFKEARAAARLQHRNIVTVYEFGDADGSPYISMEFLRGQSLTSRMRSEPPLKLDEKLDIVVQLCTGLHHAHALGVIHRDVKPANVWIQPDGTVKLLDFGIARVAAAATATHGKEGFGSVPYMAPERFGSGPVDARADIFAVGVILYELLAGCRPFDGDSPTVIANKILHETPPPLRSVVKGLPAGLLAVVDRALQKRPEARFSTAGDLGAEIQSATVERTGHGSGRDAPLGKTLARTVGFDKGEPEGRFGRTGEGRGLGRGWAFPVPGKGWAMAAAGVVIAVLAAILWVGTSWRGLPAGGAAAKGASAKGASLKGASAKGASAAGPTDTPPGEAHATTNPPPSEVTVKVESVPDGAAIELIGTSVRKTTPAELTIVRGQPARLRLTKPGFLPRDIDVAEEDIAAGRMAVSLTKNQETVTISASGPYPFEIVLGTSVISSAKDVHQGVIVKGRQTIRLRAAETLLDTPYTVDPAVTRAPKFTVPESGSLYLTVAPSLQRCKAFVGTKALGDGPWDQTPLAPASYMVRLVECPNVGVIQRPALIRSGETLQLRITVQ
jgi:hypothetical protein